MNNLVTITFTYDNDKVEKIYLQSLEAREAMNESIILDKDPYNVLNLAYMKLEYQLKAILNYAYHKIYTNLNEDTADPGLAKGYSILDDLDNIKDALVKFSRSEHKLFSIQ